MSLIQVLLSSSYRSYGISSLKQDAEEISRLVQYLRNGPTPRERIILFGHSTGCQDTLRYLGDRPLGYSNGVDGVILHACVSDRHYLMERWPQAATILQWSIDTLREGKDELYPRLLNGVPFTAYRLRSLLSVGGDDDYFSMDLLPDHLQEGIKVLHGIPTLVLFSGADEFVADKAVYEILISAYEHSCEPDQLSWNIIKNADHSVRQPEAQAELINTVMSFLKAKFLICDM